jgi:hypothetical protein
MNSTAANENMLKHVAPSLARAPQSVSTDFGYQTSNSFDGHFNDEALLTHRAAGLHFWDATVQSKISNQQSQI